MHHIDVDCGERVVERSKPPTLRAKARSDRGDLLIATAGDSAQTSRIIDGRVVTSGECRVGLYPSTTPARARARANEEMFPWRMLRRLRRLV